ncbi:DnaJ domain-containing protein [Ostreibacterium oceani]|uniref:DnaJ domain-containing protein n=1 Tax=Ostreibacterium oceani TaxID=2654998 RepID=A0A6N7EW33_9GAMM|nr:DnaJ domain-containing protein [Ostreibacterium oceani]MPV86103.1 DnaJ domain-containing protein [Ostreibacterium oceani]
MLKPTLSGLIILTACALAISPSVLNTFTGSALWLWLLFCLGLGASAHWLSDWIVGQLETQRDSPILQKKQAQLKANQRQRERRLYSQQDIGFYYFKSTFLFAGHIAASDGEICQHEQAHLDDIMARLQLDRPRIDAATRYFHEGAAADFDTNAAIETFIEYCEMTPALCDAFLETQFSFAYASQNTQFPEYHILKLLSQRLGFQDKYQHLLDEFRLGAFTAANAAAEKRAEAHRRERDKRRFEAEKARLDKQLTPKARRLKLALAILGLDDSATPTQIKRAYREQIKRHHPDNLIASGYPADLLTEATQRSVDINRAYDLLKKHYQFR